MLWYFAAGMSSFAFSVRQISDFLFKHSVVCFQVNAENIIVVVFILRSKYVYWIL